MALKIATAVTEFAENQFEYRLWGIGQFIHYIIIMLLTLDIMHCAIFQAQCQIFMYRA